MGEGLKGKGRGRGTRGEGGRRGSGRSGEEGGVRKVEGRGRVALRLRLSCGRSPPSPDDMSRGALVRRPDSTRAKSALLCALVRRPSLPVEQPLPALRSLRRCRERGVPRHGRCPTKLKPNLT